MRVILQAAKKSTQFLQNMALKWTRTALRTLDEIAQYIAQDNPARATSFVKELRQSTEKLATFPGMGRAGRVHGTRELVIHENYLAIYRVRADDLEILRIHHSARKL
jgi:toxin ParE1/3/4